MTAIKQSLLIAFFACLFSVGIFAQTSLNVYPLNNSFGVRFMDDKSFSPEIRMSFQYDMADGESNYFIKPELFALYNFCREEQFHLYTGLGLGANLYNQASNVLCATLPLGGTYYFNEKKRFALTAECGATIQNAATLSIKSYATLGIQLRLNCKNR